MNVVLFGATGGVGSEAVRRLLDAGHTVRAFIRDPVRLQLAHERLEVIVGDVLDPPSVEEAVSGQDAAIVVVGVRRKTDSESIVSEGVANIVPALERAGARRLVFLSIMGVGASRPNLGLMRHVLPRMLKDAYIQRELAEETIRASRLDWVIVRAVRLSDSAATGRYRAGEDVRVGAFAKVSRADVAEFMVRQLVDDRHLNQAPEHRGLTHRSPNHPFDYFEETPMQRYALAFTVKPGTEQQVADILSSYGRPVTEIDEHTHLLGTTVFMQGNLVVRVLDIDGALPTVMQHLAAQPEIQEAERQLTPYLEQERDMSSPEGARAFFINAMMQQVTHRTASI